MVADGAGSREELTRQAEKSLRQGRTDLAIEAYQRLARLTPVDWNVVKQLADLLERVGQRDAAVHRFVQLADYLREEGFHSKAAALYRKVLKLDPQHEHALWQLGETASQLGLRADARQAFTQVLHLRRRRQDTAGADQVLLRLTDLDQGDVRPRAAAPHVTRSDGPAEDTAEDTTGRLRELAVQQEETGDPAAYDTWRRVLAREPQDLPLRLRLLRVALDRQDSGAAAALVEGVGSDEPPEMALRLEVADLLGQEDTARRIIHEALVAGRDAGYLIVVLGELHRQRPACAAANAARIMTALCEAGETGRAAAVVEAFASAVEAPASLCLRWVELCVDSQLEGLDHAQYRLAEAYLREGRAPGARAVAEDLLLRRPDQDDARQLVVDIYRVCGDADPHGALAALLTGATETTHSESEPHAAREPEPEPSRQPEPEPYRAHEPEAVHEATPGEPDPAPPPEPEGHIEPDVPHVAAPPAATDTPWAFDWAGLLGREVCAPAPVSLAAPVPTPSAAPVEPPAVEAHAPEDAVVPASRPPAGWEADEIDLTALLEELKLFDPALPEMPPRHHDAEAVPASDELAAVFAGFRQQPGGPEMAGQQLAAGRVFAAAGLTAEAAGAFERAAGDVRCRFDASRALAELHRSRGQLEEAARWFEAASHAPAADAAIRRGVLYDLAETLDALGRPERALAVLLDLLSEVDDYRDARARADRLLRVDAGG